MGMGISGFVLYPIVNALIAKREPVAEAAVNVVGREYILLRVFPPESFHQLAIVFAAL